MARNHTHILRYRRVDDSRGDPWAPVGIKWQTPASNEVVAHDVYHHLPGDTGTFAEEVATFGAEYYINFEHCEIQKTAPSGLNALQRGAVAVIRLIAQDASDLRAVFSMPGVRRRALSPEAEAVFASVAQTAYCETAAAFADEEVIDSEGTSPVDERLYVEAFVNLMRLGYRQARRRFPDQMRVRAAMANLELVLRHLGRREVPIGHQITLTLRGYDCKVSYANADAEVLTGLKYVTTLMMSWSQQRAAWGSGGISLHRTEEAFADYLEGEVDAVLDASLSEVGGADGPVLPDGDARQLTRVYVTDPKLIARLDRYGSVRILLADIPTVDFTPTGMQVIGGLNA